MNTKFKKIKKGKAKKKTNPTKNRLKIPPKKTKQNKESNDNNNKNHYQNKWKKEKEGQKATET